MNFAVTCEISLDGVTWEPKYFVVTASSASTASKKAYDLQASQGRLSRKIKAVLEL